MEGTINLINRIVTSDEPVKTLVFLDKSARPGAHLFRVTWDLLQRTKKIPENCSKPKIKFMNIGRMEDYKHNAQRALAFMKETFSKSDFPDKGVLVVDEYVESGGSIRRASKTLRDIYGITAPAIAHFERLPQWYASRVKGVEDRDYDEDLFQAIEALDKPTYEKVKMLPTKVIGKQQGILLFLPPVTPTSQRDPLVTTLKQKEDFSLSKIPVQRTTTYC